MQRKVVCKNLLVRYHDGMLVNIQQQAEQNLDYIRAAMARVEGASSVSGLGGMLMGLIALGACAAALPYQGNLQQQLWCWLMAAVPAVLLGSAASLRKAQRQSGQLQWDPLRRFFVCLLPNVAAAAVVTVVLWPDAQQARLPALWMLFYGCGVLAAGAYAVQPVRLMGLCFILTGVAALLLPDWSNLLLGFSFGGLHLIFGGWLYRKHGG